jgi:hypothetical protein
MPRWVSRLKELVWTSIIAAIAAICAVAAAILGSSTEIVQSLGVFALVMAILAPKS